jgi:hypothetical protein
MCLIRRQISEIKIFIEYCSLLIDTSISLQLNGVNLSRYPYVGLCIMSRARDSKNMIVNIYCL